MHLVSSSTPAPLKGPATTSPIKVTASFFSHVDYSSDSEPTKLEKLTLATDTPSSSAPAAPKTKSVQTTDKENMKPGKHNARQAIFSQPPLPQKIIPLALIRDFLEEHQEKNLFFYLPIKVPAETVRALSSKISIMASFLFNHIQRDSIGYHVSLGNFKIKESLADSTAQQVCQKVQLSFSSFTTEIKTSIQIYEGRGTFDYLGIPLRIKDPKFNIYQASLLEQIHDTVKDTFAIPSSCLDSFTFNPHCSFARYKKESGKTHFQQITSIIKTLTADLKKIEFEIDPKSINYVVNEALSRP